MGMNESYAEWAMRKKADPTWPRCRDCREPLSSADKKHAKERGGRCHYCYDTLHAPHQFSTPPFAFLEPWDVVDEDEPWTL